jgi:hypothetical protein
MSTTAWIILIAVLVLLVIAGIAWWAVTQRRRKALRGQYGSEYDRTVEGAGSKRKAEQELAQRQERHAQLNLRPLEPAERSRFSEEWTNTQAEFVDDPKAALTKADTLVQQVMAARGYPTDNFDQRTADLSVEHSDVLDHYRSAHQVAGETHRGQATTEQIRQGMVHYRALFAALLSPNRERDSSTSP